MGSETKHQVFSAKRMISRRRDLRLKSTVAERILWEKLRRKSLGVKFKRQFSVENFVIDFYCPDFKLAIELDGRIHMHKRVYDTHRTRYLRSFGINEIRFTNQEIENNLDNVINVIKTYLSSNPSPKLRRGELKGRG